MYSRVITLTWRTTLVRRIPGVSCKHFGRHYSRMALTSTQCIMLSNESARDCIAKVIYKTYWTADAYYERGILLVKMQNKGTHTYSCEMSCQQQTKNQNVTLTVPLRNPRPCTPGQLILSLDSVQSVASEKCILRSFCIALESLDATGKY